MDTETQQPQNSTSTPQLVEEIPVPQPSTRITAEEIVRINRALEITKGSLNSTAKLLGVPRNRIQSAVADHESLKHWRTEASLLAGKTPIELDPVEEVNRKLPETLALSAAEKRAQALVVQEKNLNKSLTRLGFGHKEIEAISAVEEFAGQHFETTLSVMHGGMLKSAMRLMILVEKIEREYLQDENLDEKGKKWWWDIYFRILENLRLMNDQTNKAALTKAMIEIKKKETGKAGKLGFTPVQINFNPPAK